MKIRNYSIRHRHHGSSIKFSATPHSVIIHIFDIALRPRIILKKQIIKHYIIKQNRLINTNMDSILHRGILVNSLACSNNYYIPPIVDILILTKNLLMLFTNSIRSTR